MEQYRYEFYLTKGDLIELRRDGKLLAQGFAASAHITREMAGIYSMADPGRRKIKRNKRGIAGSVILIDPIDQAVCNAPFDLYTLSNGEEIVFKGCEFLSEGWGLKEAIPERQYTYLCKNISKNGEDLYEDNDTRTVGPGSNSSN